MPNQELFRSDFVASLQPGKLIAPLVRSVKAMMAAASTGKAVSNGSYVALHLRFEELSGSK